MRSIRKQYLIIEYVFILVILGLPVLFLVFAAKPYCVQMSRDNVEKIYESIKNIDLDNLTEEDFGYLKECENGSTQFAIGYKDNGSIHVVYGTSYGNQHNFGVKMYRKQLEKNMDMYSETPEAAINHKGAMRLRGIINQHGETYYVLIRQSIKVLLGALDYLTIAFVAVVVIAFVIGSILIVVYTKKLTRPIKKMERISNKIANLDFSEKLAVESRLTEIDNLSASINTMSIRIQRYLSDLQNYNYCLREENFSASRLEEQRQSCVNSISHELKTPLAIVSSQLALIQDLPADMDKDGYFESVNEEIEKMSRLISMLLNNSFDLYSYDGDLVRVNMSDIVQEIINKYEYLFDYKGLFCSSEITPNCYIKADARYLEMAIHNYLANAVEHSAENGVVDVKLYRDDGRVIISVYNQGDNIPVDVLESIWNRYFRQTKEELSIQGNIGMGLSIVKSVMNIHHGHCYVENEEDGVTFYMEFEACEENEDDDNQSS